MPEGDGYLAAIINFRYMANAAWSTEEAVKNHHSLIISGFCSEPQPVAFTASGKWPNQGTRDSATIMFADFKGLRVLPKHLNSIAQVRTNQHIFRTLSLKVLTIMIFPQTHYEYRGILKMKILKQLAAASIVIFLLSPQVYANSLALRFLGTGDIKSLADTLGEIGIDLRKDTNLSPIKIAELETYIVGCWAVPMVDPSSELPLGTGIDCLWPLDGAAGRFR